MFCFAGCNSYALASRCCTSEHSLGATKPCLEELVQRLRAEGIKPFDDLQFLGRRCVHWSLHQVCAGFVLAVLWMVGDGCGCQVFVSTGSWQLPQPWIVDVGREARFACCKRKREARGVVGGFFHCFSLFVFLGNGKWKGWNELCLLMICLEKQ